MLQWTPEVIGRGTDPNAGARLTQLTSAALISHDIYCEERYTGTDGRYIALLRSPLGVPPEELWIYDSHSHMVARLSDAIDGIPTSGLFQDGLYYSRPGEKSPRVLVRVDMKTLEQQEVADLSACPLTRWPIATVSPDERYFVSNMRLSKTMWGLYRVDLHTGAWEVFHEHIDICNPHPQYEPRHGRHILVQLNHDADLDEHENIIALAGSRGATLYVIDADGGNVQYLPVGQPYGDGVTGHECWIGDTGRIILTASVNGLHEVQTVAPGDTAAHCLWRGIQFVHISTSCDGRYWVSDDYRNGRIYVGSTTSPRMRPLCDSGASFAGPQYSHPHPYMTPDNTRVIFNSDRTGLAQVWCAEIPEDFLASLND